MGLSYEEILSCSDSNRYSFDYTRTFYIHVPTCIFFKCVDSILYSDGNIRRIRITRVLSNKEIHGIVISFLRGRRMCFQWFFSKRIRRQHGSVDHFGSLDFYDRDHKDNIFREDLCKKSQSLHYKDHIFECRGIDRNHGRGEPFL